MKIVALKIKRQKNNITQEKLAKEVKLSVMSLHRYETGERVPDVHTAIRIADTLGIETYEDFKQLYPQKINL